MNDEVMVTVHFLHHTEKAVLIQDEDMEEIWIPKSQITDSDVEDWDSMEREEEITIGIPRWLAEDKGLA